MPDYIFRASVTNRLAETRAALRRIEDASARLENRESDYAHEIQRLGVLYRLVEAVWAKAVEEGVPHV